MSIANIMKLSPKELKFLSMMNEIRLSDGKLFKRDYELASKIFSFSDAELNTAVKKLVKMSLLTELDLGGNEIVYFHTKKVSQYELDKELKSIMR